MGNDFFRFKQFIVRQGSAAMKVGVDGVLLGAWANTEHTDRILDVGTGTGLLALMLAQRTTGTVIDAMEIDLDACRQATENVTESPWAERIQVTCVDFRNFVNHCPFRYNLIVCNPPYFIASLKPTDEKRSTARHNDSLPHRDLIAGSVQLLVPGGRLAVILPPVEAYKFINEATMHGLHAIRLCRVQSLPSKDPYRILFELSDSGTATEETTLCIEKDDRTDFTEEYKQLTREFYLKF